MEAPPSAEDRQHHVSPGAERNRVLVRAPVASVGHLEQIFVLLKDFLRRLNPIEDQIIVYNFLAEK